jgi:trimethylamine--corrinoid protein Co-methyltransferase
VDLARQLLDEQHLLTAEHTLRHWPEALYLPGPTFDRDNRENWARQGSRTIEQRIKDEVEGRLAACTPIETDPAIDSEMRRIIQSGLAEPGDLPAVPPAPPPPALVSGDGPGPDRRAQRRARRQVGQTA